MSEREEESKLVENLPALDALPVEEGYFPDRKSLNAECRAPNDSEENRKIYFAKASGYQLSEKEEKEEPSFIRKLDFSFDPDCKTCKVISASVCYGSGVLVFSSMKQIPKMSAKIMTGIFGVGLFAVGTLRLLVPGNDINAPLFGRQTEDQSTSQGNG